MNSDKCAGDLGVSSQPSSAVRQGNTGSGSVTFDRAADFYDRTRELPAELGEAQTRLLHEQLNGTKRCLEIGVGTGRIALPLARVGIDMTGIDLSIPMLERLLAKESTSVPVAVADARRLPFAANTFDAVLACHVLHLVADWPAVVEDALRVLRPGGTFLVSQGGRAGDVRASDLRRRLSEAAGLAEGADRVGLRDLEELDEHCTAHGITVRRLPMLSHTRRWTVAQFLEQTGEGCYSWTWDIDPGTLHRAVAAVRAWAEQEWGDLTATALGSTTVTWHAYSRPA
jgi:SAM-dependent methyltransferase